MPPAMRFTAQRMTLGGNQSPAPSPRLSGRRTAADNFDASRALERLRAENEAHKKIIEQQRLEIQRLTVASVLTPRSLEQAAASPFDHEKDVAVKSLRKELIISQVKMESTQSKLVQLLPEQTKTSRAGYLRSLQELIGPTPDRSWKEEWVPLKAESYRLNGQGEESIELDLVPANFSPLTHGVHSGLTVPHRLRFALCPLLPPSEICP